MQLQARLPVELRFWITETRILQWADHTNLFFVLAIGRSGTAFLAELLNRGPGVWVVHEPVHDDYAAYQKAFHSEEDAYRYIHRFRSREIYLRLRHQEFTSYGEVNSLLRRHCNALKRAFPRATLLHLVRDGRDVVRSMISRKTMAPEDPNTALIYPPDGDPWKNEWDQMSRFEKLCWYWQTENQYLRQCIGRTVQLERLILSYDSFETELLSPLGIEISKHAWQAAVTRPVNMTNQHRIPHWSEWGGEREASFWRICGAEMAEYGYG